MKKNNTIRILLLLLLAGTAAGSYGQGPLPCGNGRINDEALNRSLQYERQQQRVQTSNYLVRVYFHVFRNNDGSGAAATLAQINSEFNSLLASYATDNICFLFAGIDITNSDSLNQRFNADSDPSGAGLIGYQVPGCINVFYMHTINGNNTACSPPCGYGGIALGGIPGTFCLISTGNIGLGNTIGHEVGHCLGLLHTFETAYGYEKINGANSSTAADKVTDTNADPFAYQGKACFSSTANATSYTYTGTCTDSTGASNFSPPYTNLMSYWSFKSGIIYVANPIATNGQFTRVNSFLNTNTPIINCSSPVSLTLSGVSVSSGYYMKSAIGTLTNSGSVIISAGTISTLGGGTVLLEPGFRATPTGNGLVHIINPTCN